MIPNTHLLTVLLFVLFTNLNAQTEFFRYAIPGSSGNVNQFEVDSLGNNYVVGSYSNQFTYQDLTITGNSQSEGDLFLLKTSPSGNPVYLHSLNGVGNGAAVFLRKFVVKQSGEIFLVLATNSISELILGNQTIALDDKRNSTVVAKFTKSGFLEWTKILFAEGTSPSLTAKDIDVDSEGNVFVAGEFSGTHANLDGTNVGGVENVSKIFLVKYMADGSSGWGSTCGHTSDTAGNIYAHDLKVNAIGEIYLSGITDGGRTFVFNKDNISNRGIRNTYLAAFDAGGNALWAIPYQGTGTILPGEITLDPVGNAGFTSYFMTDALTVNGNTYSSPADYDVLVSFVQPDRAIKWTNSLTTNISYVSEGNHYIKSRFGADTNLYVIGIRHATNTYVYMIKYSSLGAPTLMQMNSRGNADYDATYIDKDGNYIFAGIVYDTVEFGDSIINSSTSGYGTTYFAKISNTGNVSKIYQQANDIDGNVYFNGVRKDVFGNLFHAGNFNGSNVFLGNHNLSDKFTNGIFLSEFGVLGSISGKVRDVYSSPVKGKVKLYGYTTRQKSPVADSVEIMNDGVFEFHNVPLGKYILLVVPQNSEGSNYLETYLPISGAWESAGHIIIEQDNLTHTGVYVVIPESNMNGASRLSGNITEVEEEDVFKSTHRKPRASSKAKLAKSKKKSGIKSIQGEGSEYQIIAETESDDLGNFQFNNVADDEYVILIDIPGLPNIDPHSVTVMNGQFFSNINYYVDEETVTGVDSPNSIITVGENDKMEILAYPNPTQNNFYIESLTNDMIDKVTIRDIQGRIVNEFTNIESKLEVSDLYSGIYLVQVVSNSKNYHFKLIVNR